MFTDIPTRRIGKDEVSGIGFGAMRIASAFYGEVNDEERFTLLDVAFDEGCTFWDTADTYGDTEELIGKWFKRTGKRDKIFLGTKFGIDKTSPSLVNGKPEYLRASIQKSLEKLGIEQIDLYYLHRADQTVSIEITVGAMAELVKEGKVRYLGLSEISAATLRRAHAVHPIAAVQVEYSPFFMDIEEEKIGLLKACRELGVTVVAYSPLGKGMLTGTYKSNANIPADDWRKGITKFGDENFPKILKLVDGLQELGKKHNATAGQVAIAWLLAQGPDIIPIPGTKGIKYLRENLGAAKVKLTSEEVALVRAIAKEADISTGDRYPGQWMATLFADTPEL